MMMETVRDAWRKGDRRWMWLELGKVAAAKLPSPVKVVYLLAATDAAEGETQEGEQ